MYPSPRATTRRAGVQTLVLWAAVLPLLGVGATRAGDLDAPAPPDDGTSAMYTLQDLYQRLYDGSPGTKRGDTFAEPASGPAPTMYTLDQIMALMPALDDSDGAAAANVLQGKTFWGLTNGEWGLNTGTLAEQTPTADSVSQPAGVYEAFDLSTVDMDLASGNIKSGMTIFGVSGDSNVVDTSLGDAAAGDLLAGKTAYVQGQSVTGTVAAGTDVTGADGAISFDIPNGLYSGDKTCTATDADLTAENVKTGVGIFDVTGSYSCTEPTGDATAADVLSGKTFSNADGTDLTGTMPDKEGDNASTGQAYTAGGPVKLTAPTGYYDGDDTVTATESQVVALDADLVGGNIASGKDIFGVAGTAVVATGTAVAAEVLSGKTFSTASAAGLSGSMANVGKQDITPGTSAQTITQGYHDGTGTVAGDADLVGGNIASGKDIFGVAGTAVVATGTAVAAEVLSGKTFSTASAAGLSGSMANVGKQDITPGTSAQTITQGYHDGTGSVTGDSDLVTGNIRSGVTIFDVPGATNVVNTSEATNPVEAARMKTGDVAFVNGAKVTGTGTQTLSNASTTVNEGYYVATALNTIDADLAAGNIKKDTVIFGVTGTYEGGGTPAPVDKTGQTMSYATGDDGDLKKGVAWPSPRFNDNSDGTITDNLTGLIWLKNANCTETVGGVSKTNGYLTWANALTWSNALANGSCSLSDGSAAGAWRLPNIKELQSLVDFGRFNPALPFEHPFSGVQSGDYWSSTSLAVNTRYAWVLYLGHGYVSVGDKSVGYYVWPVRGRQ